MQRVSLLLGFVVLFAACSDRQATITGPESDVGTSHEPSLLSGRGDGLQDSQQFRFTTIDLPDAQYVDASGINAGGDIVGTYGDANGVRHGYLLRDGVLTTLDYPGAAYTDARGIGPHGEIVGSYRMPGEPAVNFHGYLRTTDGAFHSVDYPGHTNTIAQRILPDGTILGCRHDADFMETMRGVVIGRHGNEEIDAFASMHNGATPGLRQIVGFYTNMATGRTESYVIDGGIFTPFVFPASTATRAWDVNPAGNIVGMYLDATGVHGFLRIGEQYIALNAPGASATIAYGINARSDIVGAFRMDGRFYGFVASRTGGPAL